MEIYTPLLAFVAAAALLVITPGLDTALVLRTATVEGACRGISAVLGICTGILLWGVGVALGLGALLATSATAFAVLRWMGAAYLFYLGIRLVVRPGQNLDLPRSDAAPLSEREQNWYLRGVLTNLLNPKVGVFYVTFLPQFVPAGVEASPFMLLLATINALESFLWLAALVVLTRPLMRVLQRPSVQKALDRATGLVFIGFGVRLATESQH